MAKKNYYLILGVPRSATPKSIRRAFRRLAKDCHPDRTGAETAEEFHDVVEAYEVLSDPDKRQSYDQGLKGPRPPSRPRMATWRPRPVAPDPSVPEPLIPEPAIGWEPEPLIPERRRRPSIVDLDFQVLLERLLR